jgi:hypothetical protein
MSMKITLDAQTTHQFINSVGAVVDGLFIILFIIVSVSFFCLFLFRR